MAKTRGHNADAVSGLLMDLPITQLGLAGVPQQAIRKILACDINRVNRILKHLKGVRRSESG